VASTPRDIRTTLAYRRVSQDTQDTKTQRLAIGEFARAERMAVEELLDRQASARRSATPRQVDLVLARLVPGDTLLVRA
jgi:DNA invertase Pin-like site-specific DNA recombinase